MGYYPAATVAKPPTSFRLSEDCQALLERLAEHLGITRTAVLEMAVRKLARAEHLPDPPPPSRAKKPRKE
jgi:hypothetical protein